MRKLLFETKIDIEHIESVNHKDEKKRNEIQSQWGNDLHQIGNLMILEMNSNRSISNEAYETKLLNYTNSGFQIGQRHARNFPEWNLKACQKRKAQEVSRLVAYLCSKELFGMEPGRQIVQHIN